MFRPPSATNLTCGIAPVAVGLACRFIGDDTCDSVIGFQLASLRLCSVMSLGNLG